MERSNLERPRLGDIFREHNRPCVTLVTAGAGYGKTALVREWIESYDDRCMWLDITSQDNHPDMLVSHLADALWMVSGASVIPGNRLPDRDRFGLWRLMDTAGDVCIVLDRCELLTSPDALRCVDELLMCLPDGANLVLVSRIPLSLRLGRLRAQGRVQMIDADDLRFTVSEVASILEQVFGTPVSDDLVWRIWDETRGWAAGIMLAIAAIEQGHGRIEPLHALNTYWPGYLDEYIQQELLPSLSNNDRDVALMSAWFPYLSHMLCQAVFCGRTFDTGLPPTMRDFVLSLTPNNDRIRFYPAIAKSLQRISDQSPHDEQGAVWNRAIRFFIDRGEIRQAGALIAHVTGVDVERRLIERVCEELAIRCDFSLLVDIDKRLQRQKVIVTPFLQSLFLFAKAGLGRVVGISAEIDALDRSDVALPKGRLAMIRALVAYHNHHREASKTFSSIALNELVPSSLLDRMVAHTIQGQLLLDAGEDEAAWEALAQAGEAAVGLPLDEQWMWAAIAAERANTYAFRGDLHSAITKYQLILQELPEALAHLEGFVRCRLVSLWIERCEFDLAENEVRRIERLATLYPGHWCHGLIAAKARLHLARGDLAEAEAIVSGHLKAVRRMPEKSELVLILARIWLHRRELSLVRHWLSDSESEISTAIRTFGDITRGLIMIEADLAEQHFYAASDLAAHIAKDAAATKRWSLYIEATMRRAVALMALGHVDAACDAVRRALARGAPGGFVRSFVVAGYDVVSLFDAVWKETDEGQLLRKRLLQFQVHQPSERVELLTPRELEILRRVALGDSNREIAAALYISTNTVRNHLVKVFRRLDASSRAGAVSHARDLGLID